MFEENKYHRWYMELMEKARNVRSLDIKERHHVIPRCMGGPNTRDNIVELTPREHYIAHLLLPKFVKNSTHKAKMAYALFRFGGKNLRSRKFGCLRNSYIKLVSGKGNAFYGKHHSPETLIKMSGENHPMFGKRHSQESIDKMKNNTLKRFGQDNPMFGKPRSEEQRQTQSETIKGRVRVTKDSVVKTVKLEEERVFLERGWTLVKKPKNHKRFVVFFENGTKDSERKLIDLSRKYGWNYSTLRSNLAKGRHPKGVIRIERVDP